MLHFLPRRAHGSGSATDASLWRVQARASRGLALSTLATERAQRTGEKFAVWPRSVRHALASEGCSVRPKRLLESQPGTLTPARRGSPGGFRGCRLNKMMQFLGASWGAWLGNSSRLFRAATFSDSGPPMQSDRFVPQVQGCMCKATGRPNVRDKFIWRDPGMARGYEAECGPARDFSETICVSRRGPDGPPCPGPPLWPPVRCPGNVSKRRTEVQV